MVDDVMIALTRLKSLYRGPIDLSLDRLRGLLERLGNPQDKTPPVIHIAGTNGKGSTTAFLKAVFGAAGYSCHVYTTPHLNRFNERIVLADKIIDDAYLIELIAEVEAVNAGAEISFFEITTALAFLAFSRVPADVLLLEVGLGGRLDATNVVKRPLLDIITTISRDHCDWLGQTVGEIAGEKAGIMRAGVPCVIGPQRPWAEAEVLPVFRQCAGTLDVPLVVCSKDFGFKMREDGFNFRYRDSKPLNLPAPNLLGAHQYGNAATAIAAVKTQAQFNIPDMAIAQGITKAVWPGRLERFKVEGFLSDGWELWYDGGHNDSGGEILAEQAQRWKDADGKKLHVVCGMLASKKPQEFLGALVPHLHSLSAFGFDTGLFTETGPAASADELSSKIKMFYDDIDVYSDLSSAIHSVHKKFKNEPARILVTGTLYAYKDMPR